MGNYQRLLSEEFPDLIDFQGVAFLPPSLKKQFSPIRELEQSDLKKAYAASAEFIYEQSRDGYIEAGEVLLYSRVRNEWFSHAFAFANNVSVVPVIDTANDY
jgi:hypothetical protein